LLKFTEILRTKEQETFYHRFAGSYTYNVDAYLQYPGKRAMMKLAAFILKNKQQILAEWEAFAATLLPGTQDMTSPELRNHATAILDAIVRDITSSQTDQHRSDKAMGLTPDDNGVTAAATVHGAVRRSRGVNLLQVSAEFRAFRASVLRLWMAQLSRKDNSAFNDMLRFNEAVDQALAASIEKYTVEVSQSRDTFIAILGHDLRSPLNAVAMSAELLLMPGVPEGKRVQSATRIKSSAATMSTMIGDMLYYAQSKLGGGIPVAPHPANMNDICQAALDLVRTTYPDRIFQLKTSGNLDGYFDSARLQQVLSNLLNNAVQHGAKDSVVTLAEYSENNSVAIEVKNYGPRIPPKALKLIFNPLVQLPSDSENRVKRTPTSLGLGLSITREIVLAHGGTVDVKSSDADGTIFTVILPKSRPANAIG
jgi:signal transduction histidine kinase